MAISPITKTNIINSYLNTVFNLNEDLDDNYACLSDILDFNIIKHNSLEEDCNDVAFGFNRLHFTTTKVRQLYAIVTINNDADSEYDFSEEFLQMFLTTYVNKKIDDIWKIFSSLNIVDDDEVDNDANEPYEKIVCDEVNINTIEPSEPEGV
jgi:hypothetical protein